MQAQLSSPVRTCIGCGARKVQGELVRLGWVAERVQVDRARRMAGRGGYICGPQCVDGAVKRKAFGRAFRGKALVDVAELKQQLSLANPEGKSRPRGERND